VHPPPHKLDAVPPILFRDQHYQPITSSFDAGAGLLAETGGNLGNNTNRCAARACAVTSRNLASEAERNTWRSIW
jgi:hypothetical protein